MIRLSKRMRTVNKKRGSPSNHVSLLRNAKSFKRYSVVNNCTFNVSENMPKKATSFCFFLKGLWPPRPGEGGRYSREASWCTTLKRHHSFDQGTRGRNFSVNAGRERWNGLALAGWGPQIWWNFPNWWAWYSVSGGDDPTPCHPSWILLFILIGVRFREMIPNGRRVLFG